jgi:hypothetical protein
MAHICQNRADMGHRAEVAPKNITAGRSTFGRNLVWLLQP